MIDLEPPIVIDLDPPAEQLLTIGILKYYGDPYFPWFEHNYLMFLRQNLTHSWPDLQRGHSRETLGRLDKIFMVLELDRKALVDFMLLYHSGLVGRTCANKVLWLLLSAWATDGRYRDLSNKVSQVVNLMRQTFERPQKDHPDLERWSWKHLEENRPDMVKWSPLSVPENARDDKVFTGKGGLPLRPPECWILEG